MGSYEICFTSCLAQRVRERVQLTIIPRRNPSVKINASTCLTKYHVFDYEY